MHHDSPSDVIVADPTTFGNEDRGLCLCSRLPVDDNCLGHDPASIKIKHRPVDAAAHARLLAAIGPLPPERR